MKNKNNSLFTADWFILLLFIPIFQPDFFKELTIIDNLFLIGKFIVLILVLTKYFTIRTKRFGILIALFFVILYISTYLNHQSVFYAIKKTIEAILICMIIDIGIYYRRSKFIELLHKYLSLLVIINFIALIIFPNGLIASAVESVSYKAHFLSIKNGMISWMILCGVTGIINYHFNPSKKNKIKLNVLFSIITISMIIVKSSTGLISWIIFLFLILCFNKSIFKIFMNVRNVIILGTILFIIVVIFRVNEVFNELFYILFKKDASFTGRVDLWNEAIMFIKNKPLIGYGLREISIIITNYGRSYNSHNFILEVTMAGGLIAISYFYYLLFCIYKRSKMFKWHIIMKHLSSALLVFFIATLTEAAIYRYQWFALFALMYNIPNVLEIKSKN